MLDIAGCPEYVFQMSYRRSIAAMINQNVLWVSLGRSVDVWDNGT